MLVLPLTRFVDFSIRVQKSDSICGSVVTLVVVTSRHFALTRAPLWILTSHPDSDNAASSLSPPLNQVLAANILHTRLPCSKLSLCGSQLLVIGAK